MSYDARQIHLRANFGPDDAGQIFEYISPDPLEIVEGVGYFDNASQIGMRVGDVIRIVAPQPSGGQITAARSVTAVTTHGAATIASST